MTCPDPHPSSCRLYGSPYNHSIIRLLYWHWLMQWHRDNP